MARFSHTLLRRALTAVAGPADSRAAGERLGSQLTGDGLRAVFVLSDGLNVNGTPLVEGLAGALPPGVALTGGLAGDGSRFASTWVLDGARPVPRHISAVGLYGERLQVNHGCDGGWSDFGPERRITRSDGNILYELDGKPALDLYKTYLGERAAGLPGTALLFPLAIKRRGAAGDALVRTILGIDEAMNSLTFAGDMPEGAVARLMRTSNDHLIDSAHSAVRQAAQGLLGRRVAAGDLGQLRRPPAGARRAHRRGSRDRRRWRTAARRPCGLLFLRRDLARARRKRDQRTAQPDDDDHGVQRGLK